MPLPKSLYHACMGTALSSEGLNRTSRICAIILEDSAAKAYSPRPNLLRCRFSGTSQLATGQVASPSMGLYFLMRILS